MKLSEKRVLFSKNIALLVLWASENGLDLAFDQVKRTQQEAQSNDKVGTGIANSLHVLGLAADLLLYVNGVYQETTEAHAKLGAKWKSMHPLNAWGGDFKKKDGNHYSMTHGGVR